MIKIIVKENKVNQIECNCGNKFDFVKYKSFRITLDERKRKVQTPNTGIACCDCGEILGEEALTGQLSAQKVTVPE